MTHQGFNNLFCSSISVIEKHESFRTFATGTPPREQNRREEPDPAPVRTASPQGGVERTSDGEEEEAEVSLIETRPSVSRQPMRSGLRLFSDVWSENAALFQMLMKIIQILLYYIMALNCI